MNRYTVVKKNFLFLENTYQFIFSYYYESGSHHFMYTNQYAQIELYEFPQFEERKVIIYYYGKGKKVIDTQSINSEIYITTSNSNKKWIQNILNDDTEEYYEKLANVFKKEISKTGALCGVKMNEKQANEK